VFIESAKEYFKVFIERVKSQGMTMCSLKVYFK